MGTTTMLRVDRPDGSASETVRVDGGQISLARFGPDGELVQRFTFGLDGFGNVLVNELMRDGSKSLVSPTEVEARTSLYGATIERSTYQGMLTVESTFNDDGRHSSVAMEGDWGRQTVDLRADGGRTVRWTAASHHGIETWAAGGRLEHYEATFGDGMRYRWDRRGDNGKAEITGWDGVASIVDHAEPPVDDTVRT